jgi:hypothetical protein
MRSLHHRKEDHAMRATLIALTTLAVSAAGTAAQEGTASTPAIVAQADSRPDTSQRKPPPTDIAPSDKPIIFGPLNPTGVTKGPPIDRSKAPPARKKVTGPIGRYEGDWIIAHGFARRRELVKHSANVKVGPTWVKVTGELTMELGGRYGRMARISDVSAELLVTAGNPIVGKELRLLLDDREISRVTLPPFQWRDDSKAVVRYSAKLSPAEVQKSKTLKASVLIDGHEHVFYQDELKDTEAAIRALLTAGDLYHQRGPSAKRPRCTPDNIGVPCCIGCEE